MGNHFSYSDDNYHEIIVESINNTNKNYFSPSQMKFGKFDFTLKNRSKIFKIGVKTCYMDGSFDKKNGYLSLDSNFWKSVCEFDNLYDSFPEYQKYELLEKIFSLGDHVNFEHKSLPSIKFYSPSHVLFFYNNSDLSLRSLFNFKLPKHEIKDWNKIKKKNTLFDLLKILLCKM